MVLQEIAYLGGEYQLYTFHMIGVVENAFGIAKCGNLILNYLLS